jgi:hypothetical protein
MNKFVAVAFAFGCAFVPAFADVSITSPYSLTVWTSGQPNQVSWSIPSQADAGSTVTLVLTSGPNDNLTPVSSGSQLGSNIPIEQMSFQISEVPAVPSGGDYSIRMEIQTTYGATQGPFFSHSFTINSADGSGNGTYGSPPPPCDEENGANGTETPAVQPTIATPTPEPMPMPAPPLPMEEGPSDDDCNDKIASPFNNTMVGGTGSINGTNGTGYGGYGGNGGYGGSSSMDKSNSGEYGAQTAGSSSGAAINLAMSGTGAAATFTAAIFALFL